MKSLFPRWNLDKRSVGRKRPTTRLALECLEDRTVPSGFQQLNLVGYQPGMATHTDPNLNAWGMDYAPGGPFCVADTTPGVATFYDRNGKVLPLVITIPAAPSQPLGPVGKPAGVVYNPTSDFVISEGGRSAPATFLFDTRDGTICGWNPAVDPDHAILVVDNSTEAPKRADYPGLVIAQNSHGENVLYAADFNNNKIDMFDRGFHSLGSFTDPSVHAQYPSFNSWQVEAIGGQLWVTYAAHKPGPFGGVVDVFDTDGHLLTPNHFAANAPGAGPLQSPWGIVKAPDDFGAFSNDILIGNVEGAGNINAFDPATGAYLGPLTQPDGTPIAIAGLWDLTFGGDSPANGLAKQLYFNAGPNAASAAGNGLFGRIIAAGQGHTPKNSSPALVDMAIVGDSVGTGATPLDLAPISGPAPAQDAQAPELLRPSATTTSDQPASRKDRSNESRVGTIDSRLVDNLLVDDLGDRLWEI
jgi:uncharacterized protein (TIGR03118 family)